jgi:hypothetical protein
MAETTTTKKGPRFEIRTPNRSLTREQHPPLIGIPFREGLGFTDDAGLAAHFATECHCEVTDTRTGKVVNPLPETIAAAGEAAAEEERKRTAKK